MYRIFEHLHGHAGWLAVALLSHPAIVLRRTLRRAHLAVILAVVWTSLVFAVGAFLYPAYRDELRPAIFRSAPQVGLTFERKEHLAFVVLALAWTGAIAYFGSWRAEGKSRETLHRFAHRTFVVAAVLAFLVASFGTYVAIYKTF